MFLECLKISFLRMGSLSIGATRRFLMVIPPSKKAWTPHVYYKFSCSSQLTLCSKEPPFNGTGCCCCQNSWSLLCCISWVVIWLIWWPYWDPIQGYLHFLSNSHRLFLLLVTTESWNRWFWLYIEEYLPHCSLRILFGGCSIVNTSQYG